MGIYKSGFRELECKYIYFIYGLLSGIISLIISSKQYLKGIGEIIMKISVIHPIINVLY